MTSLILPVVPQKARSHHGTLYREDAPVSAQQLAAWQAELDARVPPQPNLSSLLLRWEPGDIWQPVQRFCVWEVLPSEHEVKPGVWESCIPDTIRRGLNGPDPRSSGYLNREKGKWVDGPKDCAGIDRQTWAIAQEYRKKTGTVRWALRWWAIQGDFGGHPLIVPRIVRMTKKIMKEGVGEMPSIGDLPYVEPGTQIFDKLASYDRLRKWEMRCDWAFRNKDHVTAEEVAQAEFAAAQATAWWDEQVGEVIQGLRRSINTVTTTNELAEEYSQRQMASLFVNQD